MGGPGRARGEGRVEERCVPLHLGADDRDVPRLQRRVLREQTRELVAQHLHLARLAVGVVHRDQRDGRLGRGEGEGAGGHGPRPVSSGCPGLLDEGDLAAAGQGDHHPTLGLRHPVDGHQHRGGGVLPGRLDDGFLDLQRVDLQAGHRRAHEGGLPRRDGGQVRPLRAAVTAVEPGSDQIWHEVCIEAQQPGQADRRGASASGAQPVRLERRLQQRVTVGDLAEHALDRHIQRAAEPARPIRLDAGRLGQRPPQARRGEVVDARGDPDAGGHLLPDHTPGLVGGHQHPRTVERAELEAAQRLHEMVHQSAPASPQHQRHRHLLHAPLTSRQPYWRAPTDSPGWVAGWELSDDAATMGR